MSFRFELFSTEILYEIFDYLSSYDIFHAFINLNHRLNNIINVYPLKVDLRNISRLKFDYICYYLRPEQIISLIFSDDDMNYNSVLNFDYLSHCLTNLTLTCLINKTFSFEFIQHYLIKLVNLESLTIAIKLDLIDGKQWEEFIRKTKIIKFNFQFILSEKINFSQNKAILLDSFRLAFWLKEKHWCINYTKDRYPPLSTVPSNDEQRIFYSRYIEHLFLDFNKPIDDLPNYRFIHVNSLYLSGLTLPSIDNIMSIVDLNQIKELNMSHIKNISIGEIHLLLEHIPNLNHLIFKNFIPLFKPPSHIYSFTIEEWKFSDDLNLFCRMFSHVQSLKIDIISLEMMIELIN
ncbi:unnamed protein product [Rotaria sp. Silwood1]|nr:unnamed protein product [Rotaria sp. Silwood1]